MRFSLIIITLSIPFNLLLSQDVKSDESILKDLDMYYQQAVTDWEVPGMAVAIVKGGKTIFMKGYGTRDIEKGGKVNEKTLFAIASLSKAYTSAALAVLVDEGKLKWDDKVRKHLPYFEMYSPYVTENMTIRDLLCHRSGLVTFSGDMLWFETVYNREEIIRRAKHLKPVYGFRTDFGYSNIMFLAAGEIVSKVSGMSWDEFIQQRFFAPLGMNLTNSSVDDLHGKTNVASPHCEDSESGETVAIPYMNWDNIAPAGGINSCVEDYSKWMIMQLGEGIYKKDTIFSKRVNHQMWSANTPNSVSRRSSQLWPTTHFKSYGLGWGLSDYMGRKLVTHGGGTDGMACYTVLIPEEDLGFVILTNKYSSMYYALTYQTLDAFLAPDEYKSDWSKTLLELINGGKKREIEAKEKAKKEMITGTKPSLTMEKYTGTYGGDLYGDAEVRIIGDELFITMIPAPKLTSKLTHLHYDTYSIKFDLFPGLPEGTVNFIINAQGEVEQLKVDVPNPDFDFTELVFLKKK